MALTIDELNIQIAAESNQATDALDRLIEKLKLVQTNLNGLGTSAKKASAGVKQTTNSTDKATNSTNKYKNSTDKATKSSQKFTDKLAQKISKFRTLYGAFKSAANMMSSWFKESNDYIETLNLFNVTMGDAADSAYQYAESVQKLIGIDISEWMEYQGTFKQLTSGFGVASDAANTMSQNLTQLSYDMASFFNTDVETAFEKLSSAMSGQVKGLRQFGIDTTVASLQEYALAKGIDKSVRSMTQAEKSLLRYNYIMEKSVTIQGDMGRTLVTPANSLRILNAQLTQMKRALGNIVSVIAVKFIPYVQAMVQLLTEAANSLANFFGFKIPKIDYSGLGGNMSEEFDDAGDSLDEVSGTLKKIKKQLMGFDELNIISNPDSDDDSSGVGGGTLNMEPLEYDFLKGLETTNLEEIKEKVKEIAKWAGIAAAAFAGWKIGGAIFGVGAAGTGLIAALKGGDGAEIKTAATTLATKFKKAFGLGLMAAGGAMDIQVAVDSWADGVNWDGLKEQLAAAGLLHLGGFLVGGSMGMGIGAVIDGVLSLLPSVKSAVADGNKEWSNTLSILKGIATLFGGISVLTGSWIPIAIGGIISIVAAMVIYREEIANFFKNIAEKIKEFLSPIAEWFNNNVIQPIYNFIEPIFSAIGDMIYLIYSKAKEIVVGIGEAIGAIFSKIWEIFLKIIEIFVALGKAAYTYIIDPVIDFIVNLAKKVYDAVIKPIFDFFAELGKKAYDKIIKPIFDGIVWLRDKAIEIFKKVGTTVVNFVSGLFKSIINGVLAAIEWVINLFIKGLNGAIGIINKIPGVNITKVELLSIPRLAEGGFVNEGQMFIAREAGPELVGSIGRKTAVANNDQIISGIESGVYRAMVAANSSNSGGSQTIHIITEIDGDVVGEKVIKYHNGKVIQTGVSPLLV